MFGLFKKNKHIGIGGALISGLPVPEKSAIQINALEDRLQIVAIMTGGGVSKQEFSLPIEKISSVKILTDKEIKQVIEQSAPGMILGAAAFGIVGAMIGGRVQTKEKAILKQILTVDYTSDGEKQIVIDCSGETYFTQQNFLNRCHELIPEKPQAETIQL